MYPKFQVARHRPKKLPLPMLVTNRILDEIGFARLVDEHIHWDSRQWNISPGGLVHALILSTTTDMRTPLSGISKRLREIAIEHFLGDLVQPEDVNEYNLGEALERIGTTEPEMLYSMVTMAAMAHYEIPSERLHADTTSLSFYGAYDVEDDSEDGQAENGLRLVPGLNKDHLPGCNQAVVGQVVNEHGIPLICHVMDGNTSDIKWNEIALEHLEKLGQLRKNTVFVADCKLVCEPHIRRLTEQSFFYVSRCPESFAGKLCDRAKTAVLAEGELMDLGTFSENKAAASYRGRSIWLEAFADLPVRLLVLESNQLKARAERELDGMREQAAAILKATEKKDFKCRPDAVEEVKRMRKDPVFKYFTVDVEYTKRAA